MNHHTCAKSIPLIAGIVVSLLLLTCYKVEFDNPVDSQGTFNGKPVIMLRGPDTVKLVVNDYYIDPGFIVKDDKDKPENLAKKVRIVITSRDKQPGDTVKRVGVTRQVDVLAADYTLMDSDNNRADPKRRYIRVYKKSDIKDTVPPVIQLLGENPVYVPLKTPYKEPGFRAFDDPGKENITDLVVRDTFDQQGNQVGPGFTNYPGNYQIFYDVSDRSGNKAVRQVRGVIVTNQDRDPPIVTLKGAAHAYIIIFQSFNDSGVTAYDSIDGPINTLVIGQNYKVEGNIDSTKPGDYSRTYSVRDNANNWGSATRKITVCRDTVPPVISLNPPDTLLHNYQAPYWEPGYEAKDNVDGIITSRVKTTNTVDVNKLGTYTVKYEVTDNQNNTAVPKIRWVIVRDTVKPVITLNGPDTIFLAVGSQYTEYNASAKDNHDGDLTNKVAINKDSLNVNAAGIYRVHYTVSDSSGNPADIYRVVKVSAMWIYRKVR